MLLYYIDTRTSPIMIFVLLIKNAQNILLYLVYYIDKQYVGYSF